ncbi:MAG: DUF3459 domain-containing protein [Actinobacteria bacterium]|nr:DUF3459 domain-containing protein [Actinomycetota bacterium]
MAEPWWKSAVVYQIYPRSFLDTDGDGVGDLEGIRGKLDHLAWLGVDAVWLSPFFKSPMADFGYDVADYCDVDPLFGTLADFDALLADAHDRNIRVLIDWVPNHTSDQHSWFVEARSSRDSPKRDWYVWRDGDPDRPPNNWKAAFGGDAWTWDETTQQWYLHMFLPEQPDVNWNNAEVVAAMHDTLRFWLDRGVDGFRIDVVHAIGKGEDLPDIPADSSAIELTLFHDYPRTHVLLRDIRTLLDSYDGDRTTVGEVYLLSTAKVAEYYGAGDELHLAFNFPPLHAPWDAVKWRRRIDRVVEEFDPRQAWPTWVLSNHDVSRHRTRYGGSEERARAAAVLLLTLRGTPFLFAGEEFGLEDAEVRTDRVVDPGGRDPCRAPLPWEPAPPHGWPTDDVWLPWPPDPNERNAATERADDRSVLHLYRRLLAARHNSPALSLGQFAWRPGPDGVLVYERALDGDRRVVIVNFTDDPVAVRLDDLDEGVVEVASHGQGEGASYSGVVPASGAVIVR